MDQYSKYNAMLNNEKTVAITLIVIIIIIMFGLIIFGLKMKIKYITSIAIVGCIIGSVFIYLVGIFPYDKDIRENAYETYTGQFTVEDYFSTNRGRCYVIIKYPESSRSFRYEVLCDTPDFELYTTYKGSFVTSKNSKCLVNIDIVQ